MVYSRAIKVSVLKKVLSHNNENIVYLRFRDIEHARDWMADFVNWYNTEHLHSSIGYVTPNEMRSGKAYEIFNKRNEVMEAAKIQYPERWGSQKSKVWKAAERVVLDIEKSKKFSWDKSKEQLLNSLLGKNK